MPGLPLAKDLPGLTYHQQALSNDPSLRAGTGSSFLTIRVAATAKPDMTLGWNRKLIAKKFDASKLRRIVGCPKIDQESESFVLQMARENPSRGYNRIVGAFANLGQLTIST
jgi:hypothetical protein